MKILSFSLALLCFSVSAQELMKVKNATKDVFSEIYKLSLGEIAKEEKNERKNNRTYIPLIYKSETGKFSGSRSLSLSYFYEYDDSKNLEKYSILPLGMLSWGSSDQHSYFLSWPLLTLKAAVEVKEKKIDMFVSLPLLSGYFEKETSKEHNRSTMFLGPLWSKKYSKNKVNERWSEDEKYISILGKRLLSTSKQGNTEGDNKETNILGSLVNVFKGHKKGFELNLLFASHDKGNEQHLTLSPMMTRFITDEQGNTRAEFDASKLWPVFYKHEYEEEYDFLWPLASMKFNEEGSLEHFKSLGGLFTQYKETKNHKSGDILVILYSFAEDVTKNSYNKEVDLLSGLLFSYKLDDSIKNKQGEIGSEKVINMVLTPNSATVDILKNNNVIPKKDPVRVKTERVGLASGIVYSSENINDGESLKNSSLLGLLHSYERNKKEDYTYTSFTPLFAYEKKNKKKYLKLLYFIKIPIGGE